MKSSKFVEILGAKEPVLIEALKEFEPQMEYKNGELRVNMILSNIFERDDMQRVLNRLGVPGSTYIEDDQVVGVMKKSSDIVARKLIKAGFDFAGSKDVPEEKCHWHGF